MMFLFFLIGFAKSRKLETNPARKGLNYYMIAYSLFAGLNIVYAIMDLADEDVYYGYYYMFSCWTLTTTFSIIGIYLFNHKETSK